MDSAIAYYISEGELNIIWTKIVITNLFYIIFLIVFLVKLFKQPIRPLAKVLHVIPCLIIIIELIQNIWDIGVIQVGLCTIGVFCFYTISYFDFKFPWSFFIVYFVSFAIPKWNTLQRLIV